MEKFKILAIDDCPTNLMLLKDYVISKGYEGYYAPSGKRALDVARSIIPDIILLDVMMPEMDGFEVCAKLKEDTTLADIPVIFMTALSDVESKVRGLEAGAVDFVTKPFEVAELDARVRTHLRLQQLLNQEQANNKFKAKIFSMLSHELRSPLSIISIRAQLIQRKEAKGPSEKILESVGYIRDSVNEAVELIDEFLLLGRNELRNFGFAPEEFNVKGFCQLLINDIELKFNKSHTIDFEYLSDQELLFADPKLLQHAISNLLSNAVKYSPEADSVKLSYSNDGKNAIFKVRDFGIGIPESYQKSMFEAFYRADNVGVIKGTGLGLCIAKQFIDLHDGTILCDSLQDKGTTFTVTFPVR